MKLTSLAVFFSGIMLVSFQCLPSDTRSETAVPIVQLGQIGDPVTVSGTVTIRDERPVGVRARFAVTKKILITNVSAKNIVMTVIELNMTNIAQTNVHLTLENDYLFSPELLVANGSKVVQDSATGRQPTASVTLEDQTPKVAAKVDFVQYADGSTWGDSAAGNHIMSERQEAWERMKQLSELYRTNGQKAFLTALLAPTSSPAIHRLQLLYAEKQDGVVVANRINEALALADSRALSLRR